MITAEKIKQTRKRIRKGEPEGEIKSELRKEGYTDEDIAQVFIAQRGDMRSWYLTFAIIFLLIGIYLIIKNNSILLLLFSAAMFVAYYLEVNRIKRAN